MDLEKKYKDSNDMDDYEYYDPEDTWDFDSFDYELWEEIIKKCIARQGPQYSEYKPCMWE